MLKVLLNKPAHRLVENHSLVIFDHFQQFMNKHVSSLIMFSLTVIATVCTTITPDACIAANWFHRSQVDMMQKSFTQYVSELFGNLAMLCTVHSN